MNSADATLLAALISAGVVAATFLAAEIVRLVRERQSRRNKAIERVISSLDDAPDEAIQDWARWLPSLSWLWERPRIRFSKALAASTALYAELRGRDIVIADWACWRTELLASARGDDILILASELRAMMIVCLINRRRARAWVSRPDPEFDDWRKNAAPWMGRPPRELR